MIGISRIFSADGFHQCRDAEALQLVDEQMEMIGHEAEGGDQQFGGIQKVVQEVEEPLVVLIRSVDHLSIDPAVIDMEGSVGKSDKFLASV